MEKNILTTWLFAKPVLNHCIPFPTDGHKIFACTECGDKFIFESSYEYHINRKVIQIIYACNKCNQVLNFKNRCRFLQHLRLHISKTITINYNDLTVNCLPLKDFLAEKESTTPTNTELQKVVQELYLKNYVCPQCRENISYNQETLYKVRAKHFLRYTGNNYKCPICLYIVSNLCAMDAHMNLHLQRGPFLCCDCGKPIPNLKSIVSYPFSHECDGFRAMRVSARIRCPLGNCQPFHPSQFIKHLKDSHVKSFYRCQVCLSGYSSLDRLNKHINKIHKSEDTIKLVGCLYQCMSCKLSFKEERIHNHLKSHYREQVVYPCWQCNDVFDSIPSLADHQSSCRKNIILSSPNIILSSTSPILSSPSPSSFSFLSDSNKMFNVQKRCEKCRRTFWYKCMKDEIEKLPTDCPHCVTQANSAGSDTLIKCPLCATPVACNTSLINNHFVEFHKEININVKLVLSRCDKLVAEYTKKKVIKPKIIKRCKIRLDSQKLKTQLKLASRTSPLPNQTMNGLIMNTTEGQWKCVQCHYKVTFTKKELLMEHLRSSHRDPCAAYQCLECGQCFVVQRSFTTHLKVEHNILNTDEYINDKNCYNAEALNIQNKANHVPDFLLNKDQCKICLEQFDNTEDLQKHFRIHGMAFLLEKSNACKK